MEQDTDNAAAEAFEGVRAEIALLRRAVERLAAERAELEFPDYSETLGHTDQSLTVMAQRIDLLAKSPALSLTSETIGEQITKSASTARAEDQRTIVAARAGLEQATSQLQRFVASARREDQQNRWLAGTGLGAILAGIVLYAMLAGPIARAMPTSWHWPERMAANTLDMSMWDAGRQVAATAAPGSWNSMVADRAIVQANRGVIEACRKSARRDGHTVRCTIKLPAE